MKVRGRRKPGGFSLIEVMFALAIIATVGITLIGLIPSGFDNVRRAGDLAVISRIVQSTSSEALSSDWGEYDERFSADGVMLRFYDDQGNVLAKSGGTNHIYTASVEREGRMASPGGGDSLSLPGDDGITIDRSRDLRRVLIRVVNLPGNRGVELLRTGESSPAISEHFVILFNTQPETKKNES